MSVDGQKRIENCGGSVIQGFFFWLKSSDASYILLSFDLNAPWRTRDDDESGIANMHFLFYFNCLHDLQLGWVGKSGFGCVVRFQLWLLLYGLKNSIHRSLNSESKFNSVRSNKFGFLWFDWNKSEPINTINFKSNELRNLN